MRTEKVLLLTDLVDSTAITERLGDLAAAALWAALDRIARDLLQRWQGQEIDKSDGFLFLFPRVDLAVGFAVALHAALRGLDPPLLARAGLHRGTLVMRHNSAQDIALGAKPMEAEGVAKPVAARIMALAQGGQTLLSREAREQLPDGDGWRVQGIGHWRLKGLDEPLELFAVGDGDASLAPPPDSAKAYRVVRADDHWRPARELPQRLPADRDRFVGRQDALLTLARLFDDGARLVSVLGMGGIGKTRFAQRYASAWLGDYAGGAWFCDLSQARGADGIVHAVALALDVPLGKADPVQQLGAAIAGRGACLLILDNFEQVARHAEATMGAWLAQAPETRFLVTTRELLGIAGETALVLDPLAAADAQALFRQRIRTAGVDALADDEQAAIAPLVELLDRLPLAIELAAARVRVMPPRRLLERMGERFRLLAGRGGRLDRQATLRATLDWSWDLLGAAEQAALAQLSVFEGGFTLDAAEAVVDVSACPDPPWTADALQSLVEKSLVLRLNPQRFGLLRTVQDYATERLTDDQAQRRHWRHFAAMDERQAVAGRCVEVDNLVAACRRAATADPGYAVAALVGAWAALRQAGPFRAGLDLAGAGEAGAPHAAAEQAAIDRVVGSALTLLGEWDLARGRYEAALVHARAQHDCAGQSQILSSIAGLEMGLGQFPEAQAHLDSALALAAASGDAEARYRALNALGNLYLSTSQLQQAAQSYRQALALADMLADRRWQGGLHGNLGTIAHAQGNLTEARQHYAAALAMALDVGNRQWEGNTRCNLGLLLHDLGDDAAARVELESTLALARSIGHRRLEATSLCNLGIVFEALDDLPAAQQAHTAAVAVVQLLNDPRQEGQFRGYLGLLLARLGRGAESADCLARAQALMAQSSDPSSQGLLHCQHAIAVALLGDAPACHASLDLAEAVLAPLDLAADSEPQRALARARALAAAPTMAAADQWSTLPINGSSGSQGLSAPVF